VRGSLDLANGWHWESHFTYYVRAQPADGRELTRRGVLSNRISSAAANALQFASVSYSTHQIPPHHARATALSGIAALQGPRAGSQQGSNWLIRLPAARLPANHMTSLARSPPTAPHRPSSRQRDGILKTAQSEDVHISTMYCVYQDGIYLTNKAYRCVPYLVDLIPCVLCLTPYVQDIHKEHSYRRPTQVAGFSSRIHSISSQL
jgi:hypothetical protein